MSRGLRSFSLSLAVATVLAAGCSGDDTTSQTTSSQATTGEGTVATESAATITLRGARTNSGPWVNSLSLTHGEDGQPVLFFVCAAWDAARSPEGCRAAPGTKLPPGTILRLEQRPIGSALTNPDSPGWGTVGTSEVAELQVPLSDFVSDVDVGTATYRVTLRRREGSPALATSNPFTITWAR